MKEIFERKSVRRYSEREVEAEKTEKLLHAAMAAPSAGNQQPWEFYVVTDPKVKGRLADCSPYAEPMRRAPLGIVIFGREKGLRFPEYREQDLSACTENLLLEAVHLGLGAVWMGIAPLKERMDRVRQVLPCEGLSPFAFVAVGYPEEGAIRKAEDRYEESRVHFA